NSFGKIRKLKSLPGHWCSLITWPARATLRDICLHKQMGEYLKKSPDHCLLTCVMPYVVGIIILYLMKRYRSTHQE
uniref:Uncharacterized protein n=1 Tax=Urocitellus parryii TaxID=9999 RepID=A0A8D2HJP4_UROPR